ncbi:hypothetical protein ABPG75_006057 [Micractinium tetrahymenae]
MPPHPPRVQVAVVIWTRFTPADENTTTLSFPVDWAVSKDAAGTQVIANGTTSATPDRDWTVKVDVKGLQPDSRYFYSFRSGNLSSPLGTTRTAPAPDSPRPTLRFAISSCASWGFGYFQVYNLTGQLRDLDFLLFPGDWMTDAQSQEMSHRVAVIATWDDHDLADNSWKNGSLDQDRAT